MIAALLAALSCTEETATERPAFSPLDPLSWPQLKYPGPLGAPAPRLVVSEDGELLLGGTVIATEQLGAFLPTVRGDKRRLEILAAPRTPFGLLASLISTSLESGRDEISLLGASKGGAPGAAPGVTFVGEPMVALEIRADGVIPPLTGREHHNELLLVLNDSLTIQEVLEKIEALNGCEQRPCTKPTKVLTLRSSGRGALDPYYSVGKGVFTKGVEVKKTPLKTPAQALASAQQACPNPENASVIDVDCDDTNLPVQRVIQGSTQKLEEARVCYRIFMDCSSVGSLVVYLDGDSGDVLLEATQ